MNLLSNPGDKADAESALRAVLNARYEVEVLLGNMQHRPEWAREYAHVCYASAPMEYLTEKLKEVVALATPPF